ncbi:MAG TPA: D-glycero-beta-D-manno-heptose-7-phosphate kinase [Candidatus Cloacimonadota bacterium]|nr:D-glycero-beta-D-manno-heptose-7-phosphate kinase [Candidatus Cloacimonadota bacterium]HPS38184.1 D-glycero-beta-D-manno-heptose-7-phosphate kinase [Candidatus Cloacimonadota bacterium]
MEISKVLGQFTGKRILVIGDIMLDHYVWGRIDRISPEAPVPVLQATGEEYRLGGAANVALNLKALGAETLLVGICGNDPVGDKLRESVRQAGITDEHIIIDHKRRSTLKTRMSAVNQQILRIDYEDLADIEPTLEQDISSRLAEILPGCDAVICEDYNKGLLTPGLIHTVIELSGKNGIPVAVDPKHKNFFEYKDVTIFKPNYQEMQKNLGMSFEDESAFREEARKLRLRMNCSYLVITRGSKGLYLFDGSPEPRQIPTFAREVYDVSGAGDTVISALMLAYSAGCDIYDASIVANHAAGVVCGKRGTAWVSPEEILKSFESFNHDRR